MFPSIVLNKLLKMVSQAAGGVAYWESPINNANAGVSANRRPTRGQVQVIETTNLRNKIAQVVVAGASVAPTINLEGSMDGITWVVTTTVNTLTGGTLASTDDYTLTRLNVSAYTDGTITGRFEARE